MASVKELMESLLLSVEVEGSAGNGEAEAAVGEEIAGLVAVKATQSPNIAHTHLNGRERRCCW